MKKTLFISVCFALFILFASSGISSVGVKEGMQAPNFAVSNGSTTMNLQQEGKWVVVTFWSTVDAESRMANVAQERAARKNSHLVHIGMNYDVKENVWQETIKLDHMNVSSQFYGYSKENFALIKPWGLKDGMVSYLINPDGKVVAKNPTEEMLEKL